MAQFQSKAQFLYLQENNPALFRRYMEDSKGMDLTKLPDHAPKKEK